MKGSGGFSQHCGEFPVRQATLSRVYSRRGRLPGPSQTTMLIHELTAAECAALLRRINLGRLGCSRFDQPYIVPIHFSFDEGENCIYGFSTVGQKIEWMRRNPKVCLEVEEISDKDHWSTVVVVGRYEELQQTLDDADARQRAEQLFGQRREWWLPAAAKLATAERPLVVLYRIQIDRITGRRAVRDRNTPSPS
jgi:uncharacterized protein